jgi:putative transposase
MSRACSPSIGKPYEIERICQMIRYPRSSFYAQAACQKGDRPGLKKRGSRCVMSDAELLQYIQKDLERSLFHGEGHRKVWARLK